MHSFSYQISCEGWTTPSSTEESSLERGWTVYTGKCKCYTELDAVMYAGDILRSLLHYYIRGLIGIPGYA